MQRIDGTAIAQKVHEETRQRIAALAARGIQPGLAVVLVGDDPASRAYVRSKDKRAADLGLHSVKHELPATTSQADLIALVHTLNADPAIHGILVQSPPPAHIDESAVVLAIDPRKDVDGFHPLNVAKLALDDPTGFVPCTPLGCIRLLQEAGIETAGARAVVVGRSMIVGKPMALLLLRRGTDATVTVAHSRTHHLSEVTRQAELLVVAAGRPQLIGAVHVKPGAVVVDVGLHRLDGKLCGDVDYETVEPLAAAITPVPGGVGPMTVAMLLVNTVVAWCHRHGLEHELGDLLS
jgi:methylenetetrahydrofolate dehydrogenase (NADP+)/methenyltetrahydrofolate cyclohydrolase